MSESTTGARSAGSAWVQSKRERRLREIIDAAVRLFATQGFDRTNFDDVGRAVGMRGASLYHYVKSKDDLFLMSLEVSTEEIIGRLNAVIDRSRSPAANLRALFHEQVIIQLRDYPDYGTLFFNIQHPEATVRARVREIRRRHTEVFREVARAMAEEDETERTSWRLSFLLAVGALAQISEWYDSDGSLSPEELADVIADRLMRLLAV